MLLSQPGRPATARAARRDIHKTTRTNRLSNLSTGQLPPFRLPQSLPKTKNFAVSASFPTPPPIELTTVTDLVNIQPARKDSYVDRALCQRRNRDSSRGPRRTEALGRGGC